MIEKLPILYKEKKAVVVQLPVGWDGEVSSTYPIDQEKKKFSFSVNPLLFKER
ncbi:MAG: hypothetical protein F6K54_00375 [Okeania sp. SIO3B5]|uniref:hypothetical protein n=1 Tax=Okeania sp. SIO3B5 TaxID=2607811 RepID=UPI001401B348|nr:hypothetical protein [Okeania sp. SIO3B5]NEO51686.1 hypothetical protein [Okeania sp. SIO3B5]